MLYAQGQQIQALTLNRLGLTLNSAYPLNIPQVWDPKSQI